jgi:serine/threonine-protein kinase
MNAPGISTCKRCRAALIEDPVAPVKGTQALRQPSDGDEAWPGTVIGRPPRYRIVRFLGEGGIARVFEACELFGAQERVAVKLMKSFTGGSARSRSIREAIHLARVVHPNVVGVRDVFDHAGAVALVLDLVDGGTLADRLDRGPLSEAELAGVGQGVLTGLSAIHSEGLVHRDIKPSNVLLTREGTPRLADLGIAFAAQDARQRLTTHGVVGTLEFMSPEQIRGGAVDCRTDIYAVGVLFFQLLVGEPPFLNDEGSQYTIMHKHIHERPPIERLTGKANGAVIAAVAKALAKNPDDRWPNVDELRRATGWSE